MGTDKSKREGECIGVSKKDFNGEMVHGINPNPYL
jgi:hypothetical protein